MRAALLLTVLFSSLAAAAPLRVSLNGTVGGRWLDELVVTSAHQRAALTGGDLALGGSLELVGQLARLRLGGQLAVEAFESPRSLDVSRSLPLRPLAPTNDSVDSALLFSAAPFAGLAFGREELHGWLDLLICVDLLTAKVEGERMLGLTATPTLRLGFAVELGDVGFEISLLGAFLGTTRVAVAMGLRL
jgi:hypothetical protein